MKRIFIAGVDGYLGWSLAQYLAAQDCVVSGVDNGVRRNEWVPSCGSVSAIPIAQPHKRLEAFKKHFGEDHFPPFARPSWHGHVEDYDEMRGAIERFEPDVFFNLAQMPSAPYSMKNAKYAISTFKNNLGTTLAPLWAIKDVAPETPIITIGTAGEYGTPGIKITEGDIEVEKDGRKAMLPFPKMPSSFYHATKVASTVVLERACSWWGVSATDVMQGVVYGTRHEHMSDDPDMATRFDFDECFGTAINRFVVQAVIGHPLTVYGAGTQKRGFLPLRDSMRCLQLLAENPPEPGKVRIINQYDQLYTIIELAEAVKKIAAEYDIIAQIDHVTNPRWELEDHFYEMEREKLVELGYQPSGLLDQELRHMFVDLIPHRDHLKTFEHVVAPTVTWR